MLKNLCSKYLTLNTRLKMFKLYNWTYDPESQIPIFIRFSGFRLSYWIRKWLSCVLSFSSNKRFSLVLPVWICVFYIFFFFLATTNLFIYYTSNHFFSYAHLFCFHFVLTIKILPDFLTCDHQREKERKKKYPCQTTRNEKRTSQSTSTVSPVIFPGDQNDFLLLFTHDNSKN